MPDTDLRIINADCLEYIRTLPDRSIDLVIMDPPYLQSGSMGKGCFGIDNRDYYKSLSDISGGFSEEVLFQLDRVMKAVNLYAFCNKKQLKFYLDHYYSFSRNGKPVQVNFDLISWHKSNPIPATSNIYLRDTEYVLFFREKGVKLYGSYETKHTYYISPVIRSSLHPTMKPLELVKRFVVNSSQEGQTVLDPFMGSGTTGVACKELGRRFIGCEIETSYFETAKSRLGIIETGKEGNNNER